MAAAGRVNYAAMAVGAGFRNVFRFEDARDYIESLPEVLDALGPTFVHTLLEPRGREPVGRGPQEEAAYLRPSLAESARTLKRALAAT